MSVDDEGIALTELRSRYARASDLMAEIGELISGIDSDDQQLELEHSLEELASEIEDMELIMSNYNDGTEEEN